MKKYTLLVVMLLMTMPEGLCRVPENLIGTDIFPDEMNIVVRVGVGFSEEAKKPIIEERPVVLPTKALNFAYGAECFTVCLQPLYQFGDLVRLQEVMPVAADGGAGGDAVPVADCPVFRSNNFYQDILKKEPLLYGQCNPLALLARALFWQNPGTSGLGDFRVSKRCIAVDTDGHQDMHKTIQSWADVVVLTMMLLKARAAYPGDHQKITILNRKFTSKDSAHLIIAAALSEFKTNVQKPSMSKLLFDCIEWSDNSGFGRDFPLRVLMGGVYALVGMDKSLIHEFYTVLKDKLLLLIPELAVCPELDGITERVELQREAPVLVDGPDESRAGQASKLLKDYFGPFMPIRYNDEVLFGDATFPDCIETMLRNIVCALLLRPDGSYAKGLAIDLVDDFLVKYPTISSQLTAGAYSDWAVIVSSLSGPRYRRGGQYELDATFVNMLFMLNYLFDLKIADFGVEFSTRVVSATGDGDFIKIALPKINTALALKLSVADASSPVLAVNEIDAVTDMHGTVVNCAIHAPLITLHATIQCCKHGEVDIRRSNSAVVATDEFAFLHRAITGQPGREALISNLVFMQPTLTRDQIKVGAALFKDNPGMLRMLYAVVASRYETDDLFYVKCLSDSVEAGVWQREALICVNEQLATARPMLRLEIFKLFDKLLAVGIGVAEARAMLIDESFNKTIKPGLRRLLAKYKHTVS